MTRIDPRASGMATDKALRRSAACSEATVTAVTVTVLPPSRGHPPRSRPRAVRVARRSGVAVALALALALAAALATDLGTRRAPPTVAGEAHAHAALRAAIAAAIGYPLRCLTITISAVDPDYARSSVNRTNGCGRYRGYVNASLHRIDGRWRLVLDEGQLFVPNSLLAPPELAASFRFPLDCLSLAIALHDPRFARAGFDRTVCRGS